MLFYYVDFDKLSGFSGDILVIFSVLLSEHYPDIVIKGPFHYTDPPFKNTVIEKNKWMVLGIYSKSSNLSDIDIRQIIENSHSLIIPAYNKSLNDMNIQLTYVLSQSEQDFSLAYQDFYAMNNVGDIGESIGSRFMTLEEKIIFVSEPLIEMNPTSNELTVVDPYIFYNRHDSDYFDLIHGIVQKVGATYIKFVTASDNIDMSTLKEVRRKIGVKSDVYLTDDIHDRFWIYEQDRLGITVGASLNGIGKKITSITALSTEDCDKIVEIINRCIKPYK